MFICLIISSIKYIIIIFGVPLRTNSLLSSLENLQIKRMSFGVEWYKYIEDCSPIFYFVKREGGLIDMQM